MTQPPYKAPTFKLNDQDNHTHSLKDFSGKWLVLYFYPKDDTPGCTKEACSFRDGRDDIHEQTGAEIVGISQDSYESHQKFTKKHKLNFTLLSDPDKKTINDYEAWGKKMYGREGILRKTFLIDPSGVVRKVYGRVTPDAHADQVLKDLSFLIESDKANV